MPECLLDAGADHADQHSAANLAPVRRVLLADLRRVDQVAVIGACRDHAAIEGLHPLRHRRPHQEPRGDVAGHMVSAEPDLVDADQPVAQEDRERGRSAAHVDADRAGALFILDQRRKTAGI